VVDSLQSSPEVCAQRNGTRGQINDTDDDKTDSTRAKALDLKVQQRVNSELQRIRDRQATQLSDLTASLTTNPPKPGDPTAPTGRDPNTLAAHLSSPFFQDHSAPSAAAASPKRESDRTHDSVQKEIMDLRQKLDSRKKLDKVSPEVEKAKENLVTCLRTNDRRPLDCWQEVETFKQEVGKLEKAFIQKASR
jgi:MICOS complex subunit MIC19